MKRHLIIAAAFIGILAPAALWAQGEGITLEGVARQAAANMEAIAGFTNRVATLSERVAALEDAIFTPTPSPTATPEPSTSTPTPTDTPVPAASLIVNGDVVNVRAGPGTIYVIVARVVYGQLLTPIAFNEDRDWIQVRVRGEVGWVYAPLMIVANADLIPVADAHSVTPTPSPTPTADPASTNQLPLQANLSVPLEGDYVWNAVSSSPPPSHSF